MNEQITEVSNTPHLTRTRRTRAQRIWSRDRLMARILELHASGIDLSPTSIQRIDSALFSSARSRSHFGSWRRAIEECGLDYECIKRVQQRWSRETILEAIRAQQTPGPHQARIEYFLAARLQPNTQGNPYLYPSGSPADAKLQTYRETSGSRAYLSSSCFASGRPEPLRSGCL